MKTPFRYFLKVHHFVGDSVNVDEFKVPRGGSWSSHLREGGRSLVTIRDKEGNVRHGLQYRQAERIEVSVRG